MKALACVLGVVLALGSIVVSADEIRSKSPMTSQEMQSHIDMFIKSLQPRMVSSTFNSVRFESPYETIEFRAPGIGIENSALRTLYRAGFHLGAFFAFNNLDFYVNSAKKFTQDIEANRAENNLVLQQEWLQLNSTPSNEQDDYRGAREIYLAVLQRHEERLDLYFQYLGRSPLIQLLVKSEKQRIRRLPPYLVLEVFASAEMEQALTQIKEKTKDSINLLQ